jgi:lipoyl(octanoyl) transferase
MAAPLWVVRAGLVGYRRAWAWQRDLVRRRAGGEIPDTVLLLEHPHTYTITRRGGDADVLVPREELAAQGAVVVRTDRGGKATYHGPGQLVGYPITLLDRAPDLRAMVGRVLDALVGLAADYGVQAHPEHGDLTGVWVGEPPHDRKLAALGMRVTRRVTSHGFALNCTTDLERFNAIIPCGLPDKGVCSLSSLLGRDVPVAEVIPVAAAHLARRLDRTLVEVDLATLDLPAEDYWPEEPPTRTASLTASET